MAWTDLSSAFTYNSQLTSAQQRALRDNITALANGDAGAPRIQQFALGHQPKNIVNLYGKPSIPLDSVTGPFLFFKNVYDKILHCKLYGCPKPDETTVPNGIIKFQLKAAYNDQTVEAAVTEVQAIRYNTIKAWYKLASLDISVFPNDIMLEISLSCSGTTSMSQYYFYPNSMVFYTTSS